MYISNQPLSVCYCQQRTSHGRPAVRGGQRPPHRPAGLLPHREVPRTRRHRRQATASTAARSSRKPRGRRQIANRRAMLLQLCQLRRELRRAGWLPPASPRPSKSDWHGERIPTLEPAYPRHCCCQLRRRDCRRGGKPGSGAEQQEGIRGVPQRLPSRHPAAGTCPWRSSCLDAPGAPCLFCNRRKLTSART
jgi:hypothetical protein